MAQERVVIVKGTRTPFVRARTVFKHLPASTLGGATLRETVARSEIDPQLIEEIYFGMVSPPSEGTNVAREALFDSGLPASIPCTTINRYCASAAEAIAGITAKIQSGQIDIGLAGGVESISGIQALFSLEASHFMQDFMKAQSPVEQLTRLSRFKPRMLMPQTPGIKEPTTGLTMGQSADLMARLFKISREQQDQYAFESHQKAHRAWERGFYTSHVVAVATPEGVVIDRDTDIRPDTSLEKLAQLKPAFYKEGSVTAGNASPLTDGAACVLLMSESKAKELNMSPLGTLRSIVATGIDLKKEPLLIGPAFAIPRALKKAGVQWQQLDLIEMHEAFAAQVLSTLQALESKAWCHEKLDLSQPIGPIDRSKLNVNGGSIPLGHPFGATGARLMIQILQELRLRKKNLGLISLCAAGGLGMVMVVEAL